MRFVEAGEKGVSVKLHPRATQPADPKKKDDGKIFHDVTDDGQDLVIVKGRVVRVDVPSSRMGIALSQLIYPTDNSTGYTLLVETDEAPTVIEQPLNDRLSGLDKVQQEVELRHTARRLGLTVSDGPSVDAGEYSDMATKGQVAATVVTTTPDAATDPPKENGSTTSKTTVKK